MRPAFLFPEKLLPRNQINRLSGFPPIQIGAQIAFNLFARITSAAGDRVNVPITAQDGRIFIGPVAVARIGPLAAPGS